VYAYLALRGGPRRFTPDFPDPALLGIPKQRSRAFTYGAITLYGPPFQNGSASTQFCNSVEDLVLSPSGPTTPTWQRHQAVTPRRFRLIPFRSPLLRESLLLYIPRATEMFQFARFPLPTLYIQAGVTPHDGCRVSPFGHPRIKAWSTAPRGLSQPPTSFIGSTRQGIHRWLFVTWKSTKMLVLAMQFSKNRARKAQTPKPPHTQQPQRRNNHSTFPESEREDDRQPTPNHKAKHTSNDRTPTNGQLVINWVSHCQTSPKASQQTHETP
jgi:hypothetical protein